MRRVGLVLGAGGVVGQAYHAGVMSVLERDWGLDSDATEVVVGTSAGSVTGTLLRLGISAASLAAWSSSDTLTDSSVLGLQMATNRLPDLRPLDPMSMLLRRPTIPAPSMIGRAIVRPWQFRPLAAALALLAPGLEDIEEQLSGLTDLQGAAWPDRELWICAVRRRDGRRVVFGRPGSAPATISQAVGASCAVPGYFAPVRIGEHTYVDGGAHSPTNAATLMRRFLDLVVVVSPMSGPPGPRRTLYAASRRHARRVLDRECAALHRVGIPTLVFSPGAAEQEAMGDDLMSNRHLIAVVAAAAAGAAAACEKPEARQLLRGIGKDHTRRETGS